MVLPLHRCLDALITMGVLVPTGDRLAVRRTAQFFLNSFQVWGQEATAACKAVVYEPCQDCTHGLRISFCTRADRPSFHLHLATA